MSTERRATLQETLGRPVSTSWVGVRATYGTTMVPGGLRNQGSRAVRRPARLVAQLQSGL